MKLDKKTKARILFGIFVIALLLAVMALQSGVFSGEPDRVDLKGIEVAAPTGTSAPAGGWWDEMPTPLPFN